MKIVRTQAFDAWLADLSDSKVKTAVLVRVQRLAQGHMGDVRGLGDGISELRIHVAPAGGSTSCVAARN